MRRWGLRIGQKLGLFICGLQLAIVAALSFHFEREQMRVLTRELESKADTYAQLVAAQMSSAVAFDDRETAREVFEAVSSDSDLSAAALWLSDGKLLHALRTSGATAQNAKGGVARRQVFNLSDRILAVSPVQSREGPTGTLALETSFIRYTQVTAHPEVVTIAGLSIPVADLETLAVMKAAAVHDRGTKYESVRNHTPTRPQTAAPSSKRRFERARRSRSLPCAVERS